MNWRVKSHQGHFLKATRTLSSPVACKTLSVKSHRSWALKICKQTVAHAQGHNISAILLPVTKATEHNRHIVKGHMHDLSHSVLKINVLYTQYCTGKTQHNKPFQTC